VPLPQILTISRTTADEARKHNLCGMRRPNYCSTGAYALILTPSTVATANHSFAGNPLSRYLILTVMNTHLRLPPRG
jgi:hypothetical protein